jgi:hypothetical protein
MKKKQTAVDLLVSILNKDGFTPVLTDEEIQQAKQMEKEQIMDAANKLLYHSTGPSDTAAKQYYNETYGDK